MPWQQNRAMGLLPDMQNCGLRMRWERFPHHRLQRKLLVNDPGIHHRTCVTHMPWCMSVSLTRGGGETFPAVPAHAQPAILHIWQEAHGDMLPKATEYPFIVENEIGFLLKTGIIDIISLSMACLLTYWKHVKCPWTELSTTELMHYMVTPNNCIKKNKYL